MTDNKQHAFNPGIGGDPQQQPPQSSEMPTGGSAFPSYPTAGGYPSPGVGYPQQAGGYPQQGGYPPQQASNSNGGGGYPAGPDYGAAPMGGMPGVGFPQAGGFGMGDGGFGGPPMIGPMAGSGVPLDHEDRHEEPKPHVDGNAEGMAFSDKTIKMAFIRKVYSILMVQLAATIAIIALFCFHDGIKHWLRTGGWSGPGGIFMICCVVIAIFLLISLSLTRCEGIRRRSPSNIILLGVFTLTYGVLLGVISSMYNISVVVLAVGMTFVVCLSITLFSFQTKWDFTTMGGMLFVGLIIFFLSGFLILFFRPFPIFHMIFAAVGTLLFSFYLVYDTLRMIGGSHKYSISPEEYIFAALNIYLDVVMIFKNQLSCGCGKD